MRTITFSSFHSLGTVARVTSCLLLSIVLVACQPSSSSTQPVNRAQPMVEPAIAVRVADVTAASGPQSLRFAGTVRPRQRAELTFQVGGVLQERAEVGQTVTNGQALARLYNPELGPALEVAQARLLELQTQSGQAQRDVERAQQLFDRSALSAQELEQQVARRDALAAAVNSAQAALRQASGLQQETTLLAPFSGSVEAVLVEPGEFVAPGQPVLRLAAASGYEVEVRVPANLLAGLAAGDSIPMRTSLRSGEWQGRIIEVGQSASQGSLLYPLIVSVEEGSAQSGDAVEVVLSRPGSAQLSVPMSAVARTGEGLTVLRLDGDRVQRVLIDVQGIRGEYALLNPGALSAGDQVVYAGLSRLSDGDMVELLP